VKRHQSDLTIPIDRDKLPPISTREVAAMGLDPDEPEVREIIARNAGVAERPTLVPCPACPHCTLCCDARMVTPDRAADYLELSIDLDELDEP
jgi:hypothetical protein